MACLTVLCFYKTISSNNNILTKYDNVLFGIETFEQRQYYFNRYFLFYKQGYLHFGNRDSEGNFQEGPDHWTAPTVEINITDNDIFLPYPESDVIQNPLLKEEPVPYTFNE